MRPSSPIIYQGSTPTAMKAITMHTYILAHQSTTPKTFFSDMNNGQNAAYCTVNSCISARTYRCGQQL